MKEYLVFLMLFVVIPPVTALSSEIIGPDTEIRDSQIFVSTGLSYTEELESKIKTGIEKEYIFTIELFRVWDFWPDEFVVSKKILRSVKYDKLREQFFTSANDGTSKTKAKFKDFNASKAWVFRIKDVKIANVRELDPGSYYLRVVIESKSRELPRMIGLLMFFIPEVEMSLAKESKPFIIGFKK